MIWQIAAGILIACIPVGLVVFGLILAGEAMRVNDEAASGGGFIMAIVGLVAGVGLIWFGLAH